MQGSPRSHACIDNPLASPPSSCLPQLALAALPAMAALFAATAHPGCLGVVGEALEVQSEQEGVAAAACQALAAACDAALPTLQVGGLGLVAAANQLETDACVLRKKDTCTTTPRHPQLQGEGLREHCSLVTALLGLACQCAAYAPAHAWASPALPLLLQLAGAAARLREADPVARALDFAGRVIGMEASSGAEDGVGPAHVEAVRGVLGSQGKALVGALLAALCDTCPRHLMRNAADCVRQLMAHPALGAAAAGWLAAAAGSGQLPGAGDGHLTADDCASLAALAPGLRGPRFNALLVDFGLLARGQNTSDVLLAYEL